MERHHPLVVTGLGKIEFEKPSPLRQIGEIDFFDLKTEAALLHRVEARWTNAAREIEEALNVASSFAPDAKVDPERWAIEAEIKDLEGSLELRFSPDGIHAWVIGLDGKRLEGLGLGANGSVRIDVTGDRTRALEALREARDEVRDLIDGESRRDTWDRLDEIPAEKEVARVITGSPENAPDPLLGALAGDLSAPPPFSPPPSMPPTPSPLPLLSVPQRSSIPTRVRTPPPVVNAPIKPIPTPRPDVSQSAAPVVRGAMLLGPYDDPFQDYSPLSPLPQMVPPPARPTGPERPRVDRLRRVPVDLAATIIRAGKRVPARVLEINVAGAFAAVRFEVVPMPNEVVELETSGLPTIRCRVVHHRSREEAAAYGLAEGVGLELLPEPTATSQASIPHALVLMVDGEARKRVSGVLAAEGVLPIFAAALPAACSCLLHHPVSMVVLDDHFNNGDWLAAAEALGIDRRGTPVIMIEDRYFPLASYPSWATRTTVDGFAKPLVRSALATRIS